MFLELSKMFVMCFVAAVAMVFGLIVAEKVVDKALPAGAIYGAGVVSIMKNGMNRSMETVKNLGSKALYGAGWVAGTTKRGLAKLIPFRKEASNNEALTVAGATA